MADQAPLEPKDKSDSKWIRDAGYSGGIKEFMISYGLKFPNEIDQAKNLIDEFRKEDQKEWEAANTSNPPDGLTGSTAKNDVLEKQKTDPKLIETAMLWHRRLGHVSYHTVKHLPEACTGVDVKLSDLHVEDMPACSTCSALGDDPFAESDD